MKLLVKSSFTIFLTLALSVFFVNFGFAQKKKRAPYTALIITEGQKLRGKITAINESNIVLVDRKDMTQNIAYNKISSIKVFKSHKDVGYAVVTGALAAGTIVAGQSIDDAGAALAVGVGGTVAVVGLSMILHNAIHGAELKMKAEKETIDYKSVSEKLSKYIVNDIALKP